MRDMIITELNNSSSSTPLSKEIILEKIMAQRRLSAEELNTFEKAHKKVINKNLFKGIQVILSSTISQHSQNNVLAVDGNNVSDVIPLHLGLGPTSENNSVSNSSSANGNNSSNSSSTSNSVSTRSGFNGDIGTSNINAVSSTTATPLSTITSEPAVSSAAAPSAPVTTAVASTSKVSGPLLLDGVNVENIQPEHRILHSWKGTSTKVHKEDRDESGRVVHSSQHSLYLIIHDRFRITKPGVTNVEPIKLLSRYRNALGGISQYGYWNINNGKFLKCNIYRS